QAGWDAGLWPLWFGGGSKDGSYAIVPPLLTAWWSEGPDHTLIAGPFYDRRTGGKHIGGLVPPVFFQRPPRANLTPLLPPPPPPRPSDRRRAGRHFTRGLRRGGFPFSSTGPAFPLFPPLLTLHTPDTTIVGPYYSHDGHRGVVPFFFEGPDYLVIPPLLT